MQIHAPYVYDAVTYFYTLDLDDLALAVEVPASSFAVWVDARGRTAYVVEQVPNAAQPKP